MRLFYLLAILYKIVTTSLGAPINDDGILATRDPLGFASLAAREIDPDPLCMAPEAKDRRDTTPQAQEARLNEKRQFEYGGYDRLKKTKRQRQFGYSGYGNSNNNHDSNQPRKGKRQDQFGYSDYDDQPKREKRQDQFSYSDYDDQPMKGKRWDGVKYFGKSIDPEQMADPVPELEQEQNITSIDKRGDHGDNRDSP
ncbi:uncharacterized protein PADG_06759 [Paracoccidioides brasiliensis Pb18]|uniref:Uncharacterized protein n=1 Tax=Paracoccidioides brasiliensis (strain Pb18) TaxID=502780 RepID=C1GHM3_PARBD|nr:uncharacterized protein PADG_06759 [Paracoccidioides brasiliensis Pb18]EEH50680.2 hypothetical protein PADG_06759 [Paracoccidioides brasiliensis Pb18]